MNAIFKNVQHPYELDGNPTIYFAPKNSKNNPRKYDGVQSVEDFIKYLARESTEPLDGYNRDGEK